ncbi:MAG: ABC transporter substrate-binding protein [Pseudomonadota bacterium]
MEKKTSIVYLQGLSIFVLVIIMLFGITGSAYSDEARGVTNDTIKIGAILDQTGPVANQIVPITKGVRSLFRYTNEQGGIHGRKLKLIVEDDRSTIPMAVSAFKKLLYQGDGVVSLFGPGSTLATVALMKSIERGKIPTVPGSSAERMVNPFQRYIFILQDTNTGQMKTIIDYIMKDLKAKNPRLGIVAPDNESGKADLVPGLERLKLYNLEPAAQEVLNYGSIEATSQVLNMKRASVDYVIICGSPSQPAITLLREMKKFGLKVPVFGVWATCNEDIMSIGDAAEQFYAVSSMASWYDEGPGVVKMREITLKYEPGTEKPYRGKTYTLGWLYGLIQIEALKRAGRDLDGEAIVKSLEGINNFDTGGICGPITYTPTNHKGGSTWKMFKADPSNGKFIPMTEWRSPK